MRRRRKSSGAPAKPARSSVTLPRRLGLGKGFKGPEPCIGCFNTGMAPAILNSRAFKKYYHDLNEKQYRFAVGPELYITDAIFEHLMGHKRAGQQAKVRFFKTYAAAKKMFLELCAKDARYREEQRQEAQAARRKLEKHGLHSVAGQKAAFTLSDLGLINPRRRESLRSRILGSTCKICDYPFIPAEITTGNIYQSKDGKFFAHAECVAGLRKKRNPRRALAPETGSLIIRRRCKFCRGTAKLVRISGQSLQWKCEDCGKDFSQKVSKAIAREARASLSKYRPWAKNQSEEDLGRCQLCGGDLVPLGVLGHLLHLRCRGCGMQFSRKVTKAQREEIGRSLGQENPEGGVAAPQTIEELPGWQVLLEPGSGYKEAVGGRHLVLRADRTLRGTIEAAKNFSDIYIRLDDGRLIHTSSSVINFLGRANPRKHGLPAKVPWGQKPDAIGQCNQCGKVLTKPTALWCSRKCWSKYFRVPTVKTMENWLLRGGAKATDGCWVEPDGVCSHGNKSWLIELGFI